MCNQCGYRICVYKLLAEHVAECKMVKAATRLVAMSCDHGRKQCSICDPCTCKLLKDELK